MLYILTVTEDGGVPVYFTTASGNVTDDTTHRETWDLLRQLVGGPDFLYVADCKVAPVYLKEVTRIQAMLCVYFFALMVQTLLERELRQALASSEYDAIPLYPERRACRAPSTRRILDIFDNIQRHTLTGGVESQTFVTQLTPLQRQIASWFGIPSRQYGR